MDACKQEQAFDSNILKRETRGDREEGATGRKQRQGKGRDGGDGQEWREREERRELMGEERGLGGKGKRTSKQPSLY